MTIYDTAMRRPRTIGIICMTGAVALGLAYMATAGAPMRYLGINIGALVIGLTMLGLLGRTMPAGQPGSGQAWSGQSWPGQALMTMAAVLLATALLGDHAQGAARWVRLGGLSIQPSLILLPVMLIAFTKCRSALATAAMIAAASAMAIQPDRAMAGMLAAGLAALAIMQRDRQVVLAFGASVTGFAVTLVRADTLPAAAYVDQILYSSFDVHAAAGIAVLSGSALLLLPAIAGWSRDPANRATYVVFGAVWLAVIMAAALGNYPTPIVGYGGSAIIGYALSLVALPRQASTLGEAGSPAWDDGETDSPDQPLRVSLA